mgnify:CR=1 FL=1
MPAALQAFLLGLSAVVILCSYCSRFPLYPVTLFRYAAAIGQPFDQITLFNLILDNWVNYNNKHYPAPLYYSTINV